ncbi:hypothetical protein L1276_003981 [Flavobacterium sp. HSC-32F16]|uniref:hypothetical protein n=1 Tax=Flavobacterium sp. HSC-32F16 TaxID=2910964 RepID=UPI0020A368BC|nr:hypothetical protein [Flavobacterium sp. HSC-32F16]MCP2028810.1 hypothetical protein [Flavobacterium sp. HSC-32F16]
MKPLLIFFFTVISFYVSAQEKPISSIKIYLEDAETLKNINDAKVTLEGFEIPAIKAKYNKKEKYYYLDKIPSGYNTIMAYHKKYNEKGFQNISGLPKELRLQLHLPYRVKILGDSINFYKEDDHHIRLLFNDTILHTLETCPDFNSNLLCFAIEYIAKFHKDLVVKDELNIGDYSLNTITVEKKDKTKFKRFNDSTIEKLLGDKNILALYTILLLTKNTEKTYFSEDGTANYIPKFIRYIHCDSPNSYSNTYRDFKEKLKNGLIKNNIYKRNQKEISALANSDLIRINNGELFDNFDNNDTIVTSCQKLKMITSMPALQNYLKQYVAISNILSYNGIHLIDKNDTFRYQITYNLHDIAAYKKESSLIESKKINKEIEIFSLKNNTASPLGTMDLIEYYNALGINVHQKIEKSINQ